MACKKININLPEDCNPRSFGSVVKLWIADRTSFGRFFYTNTHDFQTAIISNSEKKSEVPAEIICNNVSFTETFNTQERRYEQELTFEYVRHDTDSRDSTESFQVSRGQIIFILDGNNNVWLLGETNGLRFSNTQLSSENNNYQITATASESSPIRLVDVDYWDSLINPECVEILCEASWAELCSSTWECLCSPDTIWQDSFSLGTADATSNLTFNPFRNFRTTTNPQIPVTIGWGDGDEDTDPNGIIFTDTFEHTYSAPAFYEITYSTANLAELDNIQLVDLRGAQGQWQDLNLSQFSNLNQIELINSPISNSIAFPSYNGAPLLFYATDLTIADYDFSGMVNLASFRLERTFNNMTSLTMPSTQLGTENLDNFRYISNSTAVDVDLSALNTLGGSFVFQSSTAASITFPSSMSPNVNPFTSFTCAPVQSAIPLDLSGLTNLGGVINLRGNSQSSGEVTSITLPTQDLSNSNQITVFWAYFTKITDLDMSGLLKLGGDIRVYSTLLVNVTMPPTGNTAPINTFWMYNNNINYFNIPNSFPTSDGVDVRLDNNQLTATEVNFFLRDFDDSGWLNGTLNISGNNAAPDTTSGGVNGAAAAANLVSKGWTVVTS